MFGCISLQTPFSTQVCHLNFKWTSHHNHSLTTVTVQPRACAGKCYNLPVISPGSLPNEAVKGELSPIVGLQTKSCSRSRDSNPSSRNDMTAQRVLLAPPTVATEFLSCQGAVCSIQIPTWSKLHPWQLCDFFPGSPKAGALASSQIGQVLLRPFSPRMLGLSPGRPSPGGSE